MNHPAFWFFLQGILSALLPARARFLFAFAAALAGLWQVFRLSAADYAIAAFAGFRLEILRVDDLRFVFALIFSLAAVLGALYAGRRLSRLEGLACGFYAGSALGVTLAGDWVTLFFFWELMAVFSFFLVWEGRRPDSASAGFRYLLVHGAGGLCLFLGILLHLGSGGDPRVGLLSAQSPGFYWMLIAVLLNAAVPPLHAWLPDAYPQASPWGSVWLSAFTTKSAVYVLLAAFAGTPLLVPLGVAMALYGVVYAVLENDIRRLLAYHIVSQVGYMVAGAGLGTELSVNGAAAHAFCHILYKAVLFMGTGAVLYSLGRSTLTELGGVYRFFPFVFWMYLIGAFSISGFPLFNGFISKSMVVAAAGETGRGGVQILLELASVGTFLHTGLKLPYFTFFGTAGRKFAPRNVVPVPLGMKAAMGLGALFCFLLGVFPSLLYQYLPYPIHYEPYTAEHVIGALQLLAGTATAFFLFLPKLQGENTESLDTDAFYRRLLGPWVLHFAHAARQSAQAAAAVIGLGVQRFQAWVRNPLSPLFQVKPPPGLSRKQRRLFLETAWNEYIYRFPVGATVLWILAGWVFFAVWLLS